MDKKIFRKVTYTFFRTRKELAKFSGYSIGSINQYSNGFKSVPKPLITILRLLLKNRQLILELQLIKTYYNFPSDVNFKSFLKKVGKFEQLIEELERADKR